VPLVIVGDFTSHRHQPHWAVRTAGDHNRILTQNCFGMVPRAIRPCIHNRCCAFGADSRLSPSHAINFHVFNAESLTRRGTPPVLSQAGMSCCPLCLFLFVCYLCLLIHWLCSLLSSMLCCRHSAARYHGFNRLTNVHHENRLE
jgi:hypothetical protein